MKTSQFPRYILDARLVILFFSNYSGIPLKREGEIELFIKY